MAQVQLARDLAIALAVVQHTLDCLIPTLHHLTLRLVPIHGIQHHPHLEQSTICFGQTDQIALQVLPLVAHSMRLVRHSLFQAIQLHTIKQHGTRLKMDTTSLI